MDEKTKQLILDAQAGDNSAVEKLILENSGLIWSIVKRFLNRGVESDDLYQLGCLGFIKAIQRFDLNFGTQFSTYAVPMIMGEIKRFIRDDNMIKVSRTTKDLSTKVKYTRSDLQTKMGREPTVGEIAEKIGVTVEEIAMCETATSQTSSLQQVINDEGDTLDKIIGNDGIEDNIVEQISLKNAIKTLDDKQQKLIYLRFYKGLTQNKSAEILNMSQVQVSRAERKAIEKLRTLIVE